MELLVVTVDDLVVIPIVASRLLDISFVGLVRSFALGIGGGVAILAATMLVPGDGLLTLVIRGALSGSALVLLLRHAVRASAAAGPGESLPLASRGPEP